MLTVTVGKNILWHGFSIFREVNAAVAAFQREEWFSFGFSIGTIMDLVFLRKEKQVQQLMNSDAEDFLKGFAHGVDPSAYQDLDACISNISDDTMQRIQNDINKLDWKNVEGSLQAIQDIGEIFLGILEQCKSASQSVQKLIEKLAAAFTGEIFIHMAIKFITNPLHFVNLIKDIAKAFDNNDFYNAGDKMGEFVGEILGTRISYAKGVVQTLL